MHAHSDCSEVPTEKRSWEVIRGEDKRINGDKRRSICLLLFCAQTSRKSASDSFDREGCTVEAVNCPFLQTAHLVPFADPVD
jgi:hypothetical protein